MNGSTDRIVAGLSRRNLLRGGASVAAAGAFSTSIAACSSSSSSSSSAAASATAAASLGSMSLQVGWLAGAGYSGSFIADSKGYYTAQGVKVSILPGGPSVSGMPLLISNKVQIAISDPETVSSAREEYPEFPPTYGSVPPSLREISKSGVFGDPRPATAEKGERILDALTERAWLVLEPFVAGLTPG